MDLRPMGHLARGRGIRAAGGQSESEGWYGRCEAAGEAHWPAQAELRPAESTDRERLRGLHSQDRGCTGGESHHDSPDYSIRRRDAGGELISIRLPRSSRLCARRGRRRLRLQLPSRVVEQKGSLLAHSSGYREQKPPFWRSIRAAV